MGDQLSLRLDKGVPDTTTGTTKVVVSYPECPCWWHCPSGRPEYPQKLLVARESWRDLPWLQWPGEKRFVENQIVYFPAAHIKVDDVAWVWRVMRFVCCFVVLRYNVYVLLSFDRWHTFLFCMWLLREISQGPVCKRLLSISVTFSSHPDRAVGQCASRGLESADWRETHENSNTSENITINSSLNARGFGHQIYLQTVDCLGFSVGLHNIVDR